MPMIEQDIKAAVAHILTTQYSAAITADQVTINKTNKEHTGDFTVVVFPLARYTKLVPEAAGLAIGEALKTTCDFIAEFNVIKGFLNLVLTDKYWLTRLGEIASNPTYGTFAPNGSKVVLEYCGPNTNKPLHIGHVRNMLLGYSMSEILKAAGSDVTKVNIYNDRGIAISQSMVAYTRFANGATPESTGIKGDHFVGDWYVKFNQVALEEVGALCNAPEDKAEAKKQTKIFKEAQELLLKWEAGDPETMALWKKMNGWVYQGFQQTFNLIGVDFQKDYYESETYKLGKDIIEEGLAKEVFYKRADGAVAVDLTPEGLDEKVLLRSDGTSIYITQDLGTAQLRYEEFGMDKMIYVVANEQDYHFKVLKLALQKLGKQWADGIFHLSYALVESPTGRFKSREGKTADADDLIAEVMRIAEDRTKELGKIEGLSETEAQQLYHTIGLGALKYFVLRVNPYKKIIFNPEESIDFHGHTGPFIQYTHARICAITRKAGSIAETTTIDTSHPLTAEEKELLVLLADYENTVRNAAEKVDPSELANYIYQLAKTYNKFYHESPILNANTDAEKSLRVALSAQTGAVIKKGMKLLGIAVPERM